MEILGGTKNNRLSKLLNYFGSDKEKCFYYSLLLSYDRLFPDRGITKDWEERIYELSSRNGVKPSEVFERVGELENILKMRVVQVDLTKYTKQNEKEARETFRIPGEVKVLKHDISESNVRPLDSSSSVLIFWEKADEEIGHFTSVENDNKYRTDKILSGNRGGQEGVNDLIRSGYIPTLAFHLMRSRQ